MIVLSGLLVWVGLALLVAVAGIVAHDVYVALRFRDVIALDTGRAPGPATQLHAGAARGARAHIHLGCR